MGIFLGSQKTSIYDIFSEGSKSKRIKKIVDERREAEFYAFNKNNEKGVANLQQYKTLLLAMAQVKVPRFSTKTETKKSRTSQKPERSDFRVPSLHEGAKRTYVREREERDLRKIERLMESEEHRRDVKKVLPYLSFFRNMKLR